MLILKAVATANTGMDDDARDAARDLMEQSQGHEGLHSYFWTEDPATGALTVVEVHEDEASVHNHIGLADLEKMAASMTIIEVETYGETPSTGLQETLGGFANYKHHPIV